MTTTESKQRMYENRLIETAEVDDIYDRIAELGEFIYEVYGDRDAWPYHQHNETIKGFAAEVAARDFVGVDEMGGLWPLDMALEHLTEFAKHTEYLEESFEGDNEFITWTDGTVHGMDFSNTIYFTIQSLYGEAAYDYIIREHGDPDERDQVYRAVYERMYEVCRDPRPIMYQMDMYSGSKSTPAHDWIANDSRNPVTGEFGDLTWSMDNVEQIADRLLRAWAATYDDVEECYPLADVANYGDLTDIMHTVDGRSD